MPLPELRLVLAVSLDGRLAPATGGAAQIGGSGDRRVLEEALCWADGCLIGGQTLRLHGTTCQIRAADLLEQREREGRSPQPVAVVVSQRGQFEPQLRFFSQPLQRWWLGHSHKEPSPGFDRTLPLPSWPEALEALAEAGLQRLLVLGGAQLAASLLDAQLIDELQLTLCPLLLGGPHSWLPPAARPEPDHWTLKEQRCLEGDELLLRYRRIRG